MYYVLSRVLFLNEKIYCQYAVDLGQTLKARAIVREVLRPEAMLVPLPRVQDGQYISAEH